MFRFRVISLFCRLLGAGLGIFFIIVGMLKFFQLDMVRGDMIRFDMFPGGSEWMLAPLGIAMELIIGFCLLFRKMYAGATVLGAILCTVFISIFIQGWIRGLELSCGCLGVEKAVTSYPTEVALRLLLLAVMLILIWDSRRQNRLFNKVIRLDFRDI